MPVRTCLIPTESAKHICFNAIYLVDPGVGNALLLKRERPFAMEDLAFFLACEKTDGLGGR